jgi:hypothetical protein
MAEFYFPDWRCDLPADLPEYAAVCGQELNAQCIASRRQI